MNQRINILEELKNIQKWVLDFRNSVSLENQIKLTNRSIALTDLIIKIEGKTKMNQKINTDVNNINQKALLWWNSLSDDWKLTMVHNPNINKTMQDSIVVIGKSTSMVRRMFINWLNLDTKEGN